MKTAFKKLTSIAVAVLMAALLVPAAAFAADTGTGRITISKGDKNVSLEGKTFNAYKILDLQKVGDGYVYTVPAALTDFYKTQFPDIATAGDFDAQVTKKIDTMKNSESQKDLFDFAAAAMAAAKAANEAKADSVPVTAATGAEGATNVVISGLTDGYYVVEDAGPSKPVSALALRTTEGSNVDVTIKADAPDVNKKIVEGATETTANNAAIGDTVNYKVTSDVPDMTGYENYFFIMTDTLSKGLTYDGNISITIEGVNGGKPLNANAYKVTPTTTDEGTSLKIVFNNFIQYKGNENAKITVTYSATVNENAVIGTSGNDNTVKLQYSNNPNDDQYGTPENPYEPKPGKVIGETTEKKTYTYVTGIDLIKVDPAGQSLTGAVFTLTGEKINQAVVYREQFVEDSNGGYWLLKDGTYTETAPVTDAEGSTVDQYANVDKKYAKKMVSEHKTTKEQVGATATVGEDGKLRFDGLAAGDYTITEIKAPEGYNMITEPIDVKIGWEGPEAGKTTCKWNITGSDKGVALESDGNRVEVKVENKAGSLLPSTGGIGTTIFYVGGAILIVGALAALVIKRRSAKHTA